MISRYFQSLIFSLYFEPKNSLRHNCSTRFRPATKITLMLKVLGINEFSQIERPFVKIFAFLDYKAPVSLEARPRKAVCFSELSALAFQIMVYPFQFQLGCLFICFVSNSVLSWDSCSSLCLPIIVVLKSLRVLFIFQETLYDVLYTVYFSSVIIPVTIKMIMKQRLFVNCRLSVVFLLYEVYLIYLQKQRQKNKLISKLFQNNVSLISSDGYHPTPVAQNKSFFNNMHFIPCHSLTQTPVVTVIVISLVTRFTVLAAVHL